MKIELDRVRLTMIVLFHSRWRIGIHDLLCENWWGVAPKASANWSQGCPTLGLLKDESWTNTEDIGANFTAAIV